MIQHISEVKELIIGQRYIIDAVIIKSYIARPYNSKPPLRIPESIIPIHGPIHTDPEIKFDKRHYHVDWRFLSEKLYNKYMGISKAKSMPWEIVIKEDICLTGILKRVMECKRIYNQQERPWWKVLEINYKDSVMKGFICPHKGLSCHNIPSENGQIVCPGHGLVFNSVTGELIQRRVIPPRLSSRGLLSV